MVFYCYLLPKVVRFGSILIVERLLVSIHGRLHFRDPLRDVTVFSVQKLSGVVLVELRSIVRGIGILLSIEFNHDLESAMG